MMATAKTEKSVNPVNPEKVSDLKELEHNMHEFEKALGSANERLEGLIESLKVNCTEELKNEIPSPIKSRMPINKIQSIDENLKENKEEEESGLIRHAERELKLAGMHEKDSDYDGMLYDAVMELVKVFSKQGYSGASAMRTLQLFEKIASYKNLTPLTGKDDEWNEIGENVFQNNRESSVFKDGKNGEAYYMNAIIWRSEDGLTYNGITGGINSRQYIKSFPFTPKTFYIDVIKTEISKENFDFEIKDMSQLDIALEHYGMEI